MTKPSIIIDAVHILHVQMCGKEQLFCDTHVCEAHVISRHRDGCNQLCASSQPVKQLSQRWKDTVNARSYLGTREGYTTVSNCFKIVISNLLIIKNVLNE